MRIGVTGATGRVGSRVVDRLRRAEDVEVVPVARRPLPGGVVADYADLPALRRAFAGLDVLVLVSSDGEAVRVLRDHENVVAAARDVGHVVALSGLDADPGSPFCYAQTYALLEAALAAAAPAVTVVRASIFAEFLLASFLPPGRSQLRLPMGDGRISVVSRTDVADVLAALALAPSGRVHEVTGPAALSGTELAEAAGRRYTDVTPADFLRELAAADLDPWWCYAFSSMFASVREHRWGTVTDEVGRLTGRPAASLAGVLAQTPWQ